MHSPLSSAIPLPQCFIRPRAATVPRMWLICFPYAGGAATAYHHWPSMLPADVELIAVQYPGRATRMREAPCHRLEDLLADVEKAMGILLDRPYAFFGHSMGATVAYELTRRLLASGGPGPRQLFLSGRSAPQLPPRRLPIHALPHEQFIDTLREFSGTPAEVLEHRELMEMMVPIMRADFEALETWKHEATPPFDIPVSVFGGLSDEAVPMESLDAWSTCTTGRFKRHMFPGRHFFLQQHANAMLNIVARALDHA